MIKTISDPHRIQLRAAATPLPSTAINPEDGTIRGVSLLTANREATGYGIWCDLETLAGFCALLQGRRLKAYATHDSCGQDGTLDEIGYWENARLDGDQLRADFTALDAWRTYQADEFATLFELAVKLPDEFGVSLAFRFTLAWVCGTGADVPTARAFTVDGENTFNPPAPVGAVRDMPSVRAIEVYSCDFVDQPAGNAGLFSTGRGEAAKKQLTGLARTEAALRKENNVRNARPAIVLTGAESKLIGLARTEAALRAQHVANAQKSVAR